MDRLRGWWKRVRGTVRRRQAERELREELNTHLEMEIAHNLSQGMSPAAARRAAHVAFGGVDRHAEAVRQVRALGWLEGALQDVQQALRSYRRAPGLAALVLVTLALGIGGAVAIFSVVDAMVLRPLPYPQAERLIHIVETDPAGEDFSVSEPNYLDFAAGTRTLSGLGAYRLDQLTVGGDAPQAVSALAASRSLGEVLGAQAVRGRLFTAEEDVAGGARVVVLGERWWRERFGGSADVVGGTLALQGEPYTIVGVVAERSSFLRADVWVPLGANPGSDRTDHWLGMVGRLAPGATEAQAQAELETIATGIGAEHPEVAGWGVRVAPLAHWLVAAEARRAGVLLLAAVGFLLLITCANVANLLLARAASRQTDYSVRVALGAGASRIARQTLTESGVLAAAGGVLGVVAAYWTVAAVRSRALRAGGPLYLPRIEDAGVDVRVLAFAVAVTAATALLLGLLPARLASRVDVHSVLKQAARGGLSRSQQATRDALVVCQVAMTVVLLLGGGLMLRSLLRLSAVDIGQQVEHLWSVRLDPLATDYPEEWQRSRLYNILTDRIQRIPGVVAAGGTVVDPFGGFNLVNDVTPADRVAQSPTSGFTQTSWRIVTPDGYFQAAGVPLLSGRLFSFDEDRPDGERTVIVTESLARMLWPAEDAVGKQLLWGSTQGRPRTVVGVVGDIRDVALDSPPQATMFLSSSQIGWPWMVMIVRTAGDLPGMEQAIRLAIRDVDPALLVPEIRRVRDSHAAVLARPRLQAWLLASFAGVALLLAAVGLYGVLAYAVARRRQEIGVRMALGAAPGSVLAATVRRGLLLAAAGLVVGLVAGAALTRLIGTLLYDTPALDPLTFSVVPVLVVVVAAAASVLPAWRAARVDPLIALRGG